MNYVQCLLKKNLLNNVIKMKTSWIPEQFANVGKVLKLKNKNNQWNDGWIVEKIFGECDKKTIEENERNYTIHRKATDI